MTLLVWNTFKGFPIKCCDGVKLAVGPVMGEVTSEMAIIMLEIKSSKGRKAEIICDLYRKSDRKKVYSLEKEFLSRTPQVWTKNKYLGLIVWIDVLHKRICNTLKFRFSFWKIWNLELSMKQFFMEFAQKMQLRSHKYFQRIIRRRRILPVIFRFSSLTLFLSNQIKHMIWYCSTNQKHTKVN